MNLKLFWLSAVAADTGDLGSRAWTQVFRDEAQHLFEVLSPGTIVLVLVLLAIAMILGRALRGGIHLLWRIGLDQERRFAPLSAVAQVFVFACIGLWVVRTSIAAAPIASFAVLIALTPVIAVMARVPVQNAVSGLIILYRRTFLEGDNIVIESGQRGVVREIRLTTTLARTDAGAKLIIPNSLLLKSTLQVERRQSGVNFTLNFPLETQPRDKTLAAVKQLGILSPYRASDSTVTVRYIEETRQLELSLRLVRALSRDAARQELDAKVTRYLETRPQASEAVD